MNLVGVFGGRQLILNRRSVFSFRVKLGEEELGELGKSLLVLNLPVIWQMFVIV